MLLKKDLKPKINSSSDIRFQDSYKSLTTNSSCVYAQSCPAVCDPMDYNLPGSFVLGIIQTRLLEWVAISSSRESCPPRDGTCSSCLSCIDRQILNPVQCLGKSVTKNLQQPCQHIQDFSHIHFIKHLFSQNQTHFIAPR